ncbi:MAG: FecR domain-containing protein [Acidobacteria bacterium]|nr:FecR domain-containing protein [Acidobacteriota bacterium]
MHAQNSISVRGGLIHYTEGDVYLDGQRIEVTGDFHYSIAQGKILRTESGRAEIQLGAGAILRMKSQTQVRMENSVLDNMIVRFDSGAILLEIFEKIKGNTIRIRFGKTIISFDRTGLYRLDETAPQIRVYEGRAIIKRPDKEVKVKKGKTINLDTMSASKLDRDQKDLFHKWAARRSFKQFLIHGQKGRWKNWRPLFGGYLESSGYGIYYYSHALFDEQEKRLRNERNKIIIPIE